MRLDGVEMDFPEGDREGKQTDDRELVIGGWGEDGVQPSLFVRGYPEKALTLELEEKKMRLVPGPGYRRELLVRNGGKLVPLEGRVPALVPLQEGDEIVVSEQAGGGEVVRKVIGNGRYDLTPPKERVRWIGGGGSDAVARAGGYPSQVVGVQLVGNQLKLMRGPGLKGGIRVLINGRLTKLEAASEMLVPYVAGRTILELKKLDPLAGRAIFRSQGLEWQGETATVKLTFTSDETLTVGGNAFDDLYIRGLASGAMHMSVSQEGLLLKNVKEVEGMPAEKLLSPREQLVFGTKGAPWGGILAVQKVESLGLANATQAEGTDAIPEPAEEVWKVTCLWKPNSRTWLPIEKRHVTWPLVGTEVEVFTYRDWTEEVYPLADLAARESALRSCVVYGANGMGTNEPALLVMEPGVEILRNGKPFSWGDSSQTGVLSDDAELEFLQLRSLVQKGPSGPSRSSLQPAEVVEPQDVTERKTLTRVRLLREGGRGKRPTVQVQLAKREIEAVNTAEIKEDIKALKEELGGRLAFGVNDQTDWASLPHQVKFDSVTDWFKRASGEIEVDFFSFTVHDDYQRRKLSYGETFTMGGKDRLLVTLDKKTIPWDVIAWLAGAGLVTTFVAMRWMHTFAGSALFFGISFLTGSRVLFGQVAAVNFPYDGSILTTSVWAALLIPLLVAAILLLGSRVIQGKIRSLVSWFIGKPYWFYCGAAAVLMTVRFLLLFAGFKEGIAVPGLGRLALSIFFVPTFLVLFAVVLVKGMESLKAKLSLASLWLFVGTVAIVLVFQAVAGFAVSDLGTFLYLIPPAIVLAITGIWLIGRGLERGSSIMEGWRSMLAWFAGAGALILPLLAIVLVLWIPGALLKVSTGLVGVDLDEKYLEQGEIATGSTALRVLNFAGDDYLINFGTDSSEAILQDHAIMENYAHRGLRGEGYMQVNIIPVKRTTALNDNVSAVFILGQFGALGAGAICLAYLAILLSNLGAGNSVGDWVARLVAITFALTSLYMLAANWGLTPFTGRNMYLLGLNSNGDLLEGTLLLGLLALGRSLGGGKSENGIRGALTTK